MNCFYRCINHILWRKSYGTKYVVVGLLILMPCWALAARTTGPEPLPQLQPPRAEEVALGKMLFFDRRLSGDGTMSCAVCHLPDLAFGDGRPISGAYPTNKHWRNTPTLINAVFLDSFFWDGRSDSLLHQLAAPLAAPFEMNANLDFISAKLAEIDGYRKAFDQAYGHEVAPALILQALAAFEQTLISRDSPYDRELAGDTAALSPLARAGKELFFSARAGCSQCHNGPLLSDQKFYHLGIPEPEILVQDPQHRATRRFMLQNHGLPMGDRDPGRELVTRNPAERGAFRTPPLRLVAQTGPYMHNGSFASLGEVIDFFSAGTSNPGNPLLAARHFNEAEKTALLAFLASLSGTLPAVKRPPLPGDP
ncbi:MAG: hypothetical protein GW875_01680 [Deltaproteobacteria bacterium]|nr:hypothetical protein [Deltaproteobacteria bacterium]